MTRSSPTARLDIDLTALAANFRTLQARQSGAEVAPVVKADAYGLGMERIAEHLVKQGARTFFVARFNEGVALRRALGVRPVIYVLDGLLETPGAFLEHDLRPVLNSMQQMNTCLQIPDLKAALHIDTGMNRLGIRPDEVTQLPAGFTPSLIMSHLACADEPAHPMNARQLKAFREAATGFRGIPLSLANSAGSFLGPDYGFDVTRPGISLYGGGPFGAPHPDIKPVARLTARVLQLRDLKAGESVGYGATFTAPRDMRLATVGVGYADGLLRSFAATGHAVANGEKRRLTGRVSMDAFSMDISGLDINVGDWVEIFGAQQSIDDVASASGTIAYEWLTRIGARVQRHYSR
ncbi:MAG: alanine racemase [Asticcacaulis sp.]